MKRKFNILDQIEINNKGEKDFHIPQYRNRTQSSETIEPQQTLPFELSEAGSSIYFYRNTHGYDVEVDGLYEDEDKPTPPTPTGNKLTLTDNNYMSNTTTWKILDAESGDVVIEQTFDTKQPFVIDFSVLPDSFKIQMYNGVGSNRIWFTGGFYGYDLSSVTCHYQMDTQTLQQSIQTPMYSGLPIAPSSVWNKRYLSGDCFIEVTL